jgi:hypothetical protein
MAHVERLHAFGELRPVVVLLHLDQPAHLAAVLDAVERQLHVEDFVDVVAGRGEYVLAAAVVGVFAFHAYLVLGLANFTAEMLSRGWRA